MTIVGPGCARQNVRYKLVFSARRADAAPKERFHRRLRVEAWRTFRVVAGRHAMPFCYEVFFMYVLAR